MSLSDQVRKENRRKFGVQLLSVMDQLSHPLRQAVAVLDSFDGEVGREVLDKYDERQVAWNGANDLAHWGKRLRKLAQQLAKESSSQ